MPRFEPFPAIRYDEERVVLDDVIAPPYDVIDATQRVRLTDRSPYNAVQVELPTAEADDDPYEAACRRLDDWLATQVLVRDPEPGFYVYRMGYRTATGELRQTSGVLGALELAPLGSGGVLPHERTLSKAKDDRLRLLRACRTNVSPIWTLSLARGLSALCEPAGPPLARATGDDGVHHRLWRVTQPAVVDAIASTVASEPVVIADGHHRYETALAYRDEQRATRGSPAGDHDLVLAYVVELAPDQLSVGPIHRTVAGLAADFDPVGTLAPWFTPVAQAQPGPDLAAQADAAGAIAVVTATGAQLVRPRGDETTQAGAGEPDAARLDAALASWPPVRIAYEHSAQAVLDAVAGGRAQLGLLLRPATVAQIDDAARAGRRLPEKTTFFRPKPATGLVFRRFGD